MSVVIEKFVGRNRFLSNFWRSPVEWGGYTYPTVEHAYQAAKTLDKDERRRIRECDTPALAKRAGKRATLRMGWEEMKLHVMETLISRKFEAADLRRELLSTGNAELIEGNTWGDTFWGQCNGRGLNHLGKILMAERAAIRAGAR